MQWDDIKAATFNIFAFCSILFALTGYKFLVVGGRREPSKQVQHPFKMICSIAKVSRTKNNINWLSY